MKQWPTYRVESRTAEHIIEPGPLHEVLERAERFARAQGWSGPWELVRVEERRNVVLRRHSGKDGDEWLEINP